jgi:hypothetical protein
MSLNEEPRHFCVKCFATDEDGSWGCTTMPEANHCYNCGAGGTLVVIPKWGVDEIRKNASWVGRRYYPGDEDRKLSAELLRLRALAVELRPPEGRTVEPTPDHPGGYTVKQDTGGGRSTMVFIDAGSPEEALAKAAMSLPYPG